MQAWLWQSFLASFFFFFFNNFLCLLQTVHEGRIYQLKLFCDKDYPENPPTVRFQTRINMTCVKQETGVVGTCRIQVFLPIVLKNCIVCLTSTDWTGWACPISYACQLAAGIHNGGRIDPVEKGNDVSSEPEADPTCWRWFSHGTFFLSFHIWEIYTFYSHQWISLPFKKKSARYLHTNGGTFAMSKLVLCEVLSLMPTAEIQ